MLVATPHHRRASERWTDRLPRPCDLCSMAPGTTAHEEVLRMAVMVTKIDVWSGVLDDQPGGLATILERLADAKGNLEMVVARRQPDEPGHGIVFLAPVKGKKISEVATGAGVRPAEGLAAL